MDSIGDIDGTPAFIFHAPQRATDDQSSHEIRYDGSFEKFDLLMGYMSHERNLTFQEMRILPSTLGGTEWNGGGDLLHESSAFLLQLKFH